MFIFYDLETTGLNHIYDQVLQFGAVLVDDALCEIERFEIRCSLLPWAVPSPEALLVTNTPIDQLEDGSLPNFFEMMQSISTRLASWPPATFVGYNSMRFDEPFLQRAFWQTLLPPYVTVTRGNSRLDLLTTIRAAAFLRPDLFSIPSRNDGAPTFRLDEIAPANGFNSHRAHDAMGDVEATLFLARKIAQVFPELWDALSSRARKPALIKLLDSAEPVFLIQNGKNPSLTCYRRVDGNRSSGSYAMLANLAHDWQNSSMSNDTFASAETAMLRKGLLRVALNKAPPFLSPKEAKTLGDRVPTPTELKQATFLADNEEYCHRLSEVIEPFQRSKSDDNKEIEETIFDGFATAEDERLMTQFHQATQQEKAKIPSSFIDPRFRRLAMRFLYVCAPQVLSSREHRNIQLGILKRLNGTGAAGHQWRTIADAIDELLASIAQAPSTEKEMIMTWLVNRKSLSMSNE